MAEIAFLAAFVVTQVAATVPTRLPCGAEERPARPIVPDVGTVLTLDDEPFVLAHLSSLFILKTLPSL